MYAVGRIGSYITRGVYTVSGPFHPFGGAVDIVVVQQQDGSLKSSPWYVRFGKFQGVLKGKEKVVDINVNGLEAKFHMYLDQRGEAYFLRDVESEEVVNAASSPGSSGEETDGKVRMPVKSKSLDCNLGQCEPVVDASNRRVLSRNNGKVLSRSNSKQSRILGFVLGRSSMKEGSFQREEEDSDVGRTRSLERAEIAADLLEMKWSTNLSSNMTSKHHITDNVEPSTEVGEVTGGKLEAGLVLHEEHFVNSADRLEVDNGMHSEIAREAAGIIVANVVHDGNAEVDEEHGSSLENCVSSEDSLRIGLGDSNGTEKGLVTAEEPLTIVAETYTEVASIQQGNASAEVESCSVVTVSVCQAEDAKSSMEVDETNEVTPSLESDGEVQDVPGDSVLTKEASETSVEEQFTFSDLDDVKPSVNHIEQETQSPSTAEVNQAESEPMSPNNVSNLSPSSCQQESSSIDMEGLKGNIRRLPSNVDIPRSSKVTDDRVGRQAKSLPNMWNQFDEFDSSNLDVSPYYSLDSESRTSKWDLLRKDASRIIKAAVEKELQLSDPQSAEAFSKEIQDASIAGGDASNIVDGTSGSWSLWPFRRSRSQKFSQKEQNGEKDSDGDGRLGMDGEKVVSSPKANKKGARMLTPTPEQLASLNLTEGKNTVTFTFSTSVLGSQQVDARIYLWRWDTRIVISDVDGTITKSDVLGQFMPLVGRDWSHIGVTHLFSAIKENGYQMLFLSARAISQAYITRQFLFNLKQDGKTLPDGPVVISPDGLFPSLFREVIRRAPHEFKIACLEDIKACFPPDRNPFYAGFGNRDTDEFSYLKVGIPKGKIFIINPKGEVVVNRCIDSKSYTSLHSIVNGIFPPISTHEEEDYNSWNFWKLPPPTVD